MLGKLFVQQYHSSEKSNNPSSFLQNTHISMTIKPWEYRTIGEIFQESYQPGEKNLLRFLMPENFIS